MGERSKVVLILDGYSEGKNIFIDTIKTNGMWTWNFNQYNVLGSVSYSLGFEGERNKDYYDFINELKVIADKYFDFGRKKTLSKIEEFMSNDKAEVLIIHNCDAQLAIELQEYYENCFDILLADKDVEDSSYCKTLNYRDDGFVDNVLSVMNTLTRSFKVEKEEKGE